MLKRELIDTDSDKRWRRLVQGRSLGQDVNRIAKIVVKTGQGDKGDQKRRG